jgi:hypothetical protein
MATVKININGEIVEVEKDLVSQGIETGEVKIDSDKLVVKNDDTIVYQKEEFETYTTNLKNQEYKNGKTAGEEMAFKAMKNASGYEIEGYKDADTFVSTLKAKVIEETGKEPTEQLAKKDADIATLQGTINEIKTEFETFKTGVTEKETRGKKDSTLASFIPTEGLKIDSDITLMALKSKAGIDVSFDEAGKTLITKNGEVVKDAKTLQPVDPKTFIESTLTSLDLIAKPTGGTGAGNATGDGKGGSYEAFVKEMDAKGSEYAQGTQNFALEMNKRIGDKTLVM